MNKVVILCLIGLAVGIWLDLSESKPQCKNAGYNGNMPCTPYGSEEGWYSYCYQDNGRWIAYPYRCGLIDPANVTLGYKEFTDMDKKCVELDEPSECKRE